MVRNRATGKLGTRKRAYNMGQLHALKENFKGIVVADQDYSGRDLKKVDMSGSRFERCNFDNADMSEANCTGSSFVGSTFRETVLYRTNFTEANLGATIFEPKDCYGMVVSLSCKTFTNMHISQMFWYGWLMFATQMKPADGPVKESLVDMLIGMIGAARYVRLKNRFQRVDL